VLPRWLLERLTNTMMRGEDRRAKPGDIRRWAEFERRSRAELEGEPAA